MLYNIKKAYGEIFMLNKILEIISIHLSIAVEELNDEMTFIELNMDSLNLMKIIMGIENVFDIHIEDHEIVELRTISDIADLCVRKVSF